MDCIQIPASDFHFRESPPVCHNVVWNMYPGTVQKLCECCVCVSCPILEMGHIRECCPVIPRSILLSVCIPIAWCIIYDKSYSQMNEWTTNRGKLLLKASCECSQFSNLWSPPHPYWPKWISIRFGEWERVELLNSTEDYSSVSGFWFLHLHTPLQESYNIPSFKVKSQ